MFLQNTLMESVYLFWQTVLRIFSSVIWKPIILGWNKKYFFFTISEGRLAVLSVFRFKPLVFSWEQVFSANNHILTLKCITLSVFKWKCSSHICGVSFFVHYSQNQSVQSDSVVQTAADFMPVCEDRPGGDRANDSLLCFLIHRHLHLKCNIQAVVCAARCTQYRSICSEILKTC